MPIEFIQKQYFWIPRLYGQDPETGTYATLPLGGWQFMSDQDPATIPFAPAGGLQQRALHLPSSFPRRAFINGLELAFGSSNPSGINECSVWVDPGGVAFHSASPNGAEAGSNFVNDIVLASVVFSSGDWRDEIKIDPPILIDRDAGDLIGVKLGLNQQCEWVYVGFRYLARNPYPDAP